MMEDQFDITYEFDDLEEKVPQAFLTSILEKIVKELDIKAGFSFNIVSAETIHEMNKAYRGKDESTDILTFAIEDDDTFPKVDGMEEELGDIFLCLDKAEENSELFHVPFEEEILRLCVHGLLHATGNDHKTNDFAIEPMLIEQEKIVKKLLC